MKIYRRQLRNVRFKGEIMVTNNYNLPEPLLKALSPTRKAPVMGRLSVTALIGSPLQRILSIKHHGEIQEDASENLWALLGSAIHSVIEKHGVKNAEIKIEYPFESATIVGVVDYYDGKELADWKVTSIWSYLLGTKSEWEAQLRIYKFLLEKTGFPVEKLKIYAILRDWVSSKVHEEGYPPIPFVAIDVEIKDIEEYIRNRVRMHLEAEKYIDAIESIPECTPDEKWERPTTYAVKKKDAKKAIRVLETEELAHKYIDDNRLSGVFIEERKGICVKCERFCRVSEYCPFYAPHTQK
jgi:hypothetical protein